MVHCLNQCHRATQSYYPGTELILIMLSDKEVISINFKVTGLSQPGLKPTGSAFEPARFRFLDLPAREADAPLIRPPHTVWYQASCNIDAIYLYEIQRDFTFN